MGPKTLSPWPWEQCGIFFAGWVLDTTILPSRRLLGNVDNVKKFLELVRNAPTLKSQTSPPTSNMMNQTNQRVTADVENADVENPILIATQAAVAYYQASLMQLAEALDDKKDIQIRAGKGDGHESIATFVGLLVVGTFIVGGVEIVFCYLAARCGKFWKLATLREQWRDHAVDEPRPWYRRRLLRQGERLKYTRRQLADAIYIL